MSIDTTHDMLLPDKRAPKETPPRGWNNRPDNEAWMRRRQAEKRHPYRAEAERLYADFIQSQPHQDADTVMARLDGPELPSGRLRNVVQRHPNSLIVRLAEMWRKGELK
jgi:hypothetical protein